MRAAFGFVPEFLAELKGLPGSLDPSWQIIRTMLFGDTHLTGLHRNLIGIATAAAIHCPYSTLLYTAGARLHGATDVQIQEACMQARGNVQWGCYLHARGVGPEAARLDASRFQHSLQTTAKS